MTTTPEYLRAVLPVWHKHGVLKAIAEPGVAIALVKARNITQLIFHVSCVQRMHFSLMDEVCLVPWAYYCAVRQGFLS